MMLDVPYQGNACWALLGTGYLLMLFHFLLGVRRKRRAGIPNRPSNSLRHISLVLGILAIALFQVLPYQQGDGFSSRDGGLV
jgi:hypothetical protein